MATTTNLPLDIIEIILSKLESAKPLLRFKSVSKPLCAAISDPAFVQNHHKRQLANGCKDVFLLKTSPEARFSVVKVEGRELRTLQVIEAPCLGGTVLCFCQGLMLLTDHISYRTVVLWNPSSRQNTEIQVPFDYGQPGFSDDDDHDKESFAFGLSHDPIEDDFKVVIIDWMVYSVYSLKKKSWVVLKRFCWGKTRHRLDGFRPVGNDWAAVCVDGASYWVCFEGDAKEIIYHDPRDDKLKTLPKPENIDQTQEISLVDFMGFLCLCCKGRDQATAEIWAKDKGIDNHDWEHYMTVKNVETPIRRLQPQCLAGDKVVLRITRMDHSDRLVAYKPSKDSFKEFKAKTEVFDLGLVPYVDTLFFPIQKSRQVVVGEVGKRKLKWIN